MNIVAIIQARMGSSRLPGKVLMDLAGAPMIQRVVERVRQATTLGSVVVATTTAPPDDVLANYCATHGVSVFRGSEDDVLDRYYQAARMAGAETVVRLTADCPVLDPLVIDRVVQAFMEGGADYVANILECTYPDGLDTEVFHVEALERAWREARLKSEREHVTPYIRNHPELFRHRNVSNDQDHSALRWTVDEPRDLEFVRALYQHLQDRPFGMGDVLAYLRDNPDVQELNAGIMRNEGYMKSLREDATI